MFSIALVVFREVFEIALIVSILMAATKGLEKRTQWVMIGILAGIAGAVVIAFFADTISQLAQGMGQEMLNASILFIAAGLIGWTTLWMNRHGRQLSESFKRIGQEVIQGQRPIYTLATVVALSVLREGAEIVMFTYSAFVTGTKIYQLIFGGILGVCLGMAVGIVLYYGLMKVQTRKIFQVTSWLLILLVAGMVSQAFGYLSAAGKVSEIVPMVWDTSRIVADSSLLGQLMHVVMGYTDRPSGIQLLSFVLTMVSMGVILKFYDRLPLEKMMTKAGKLVVFMFVATGLLLVGPREAAATKKVYSPIVEKRVNLSSRLVAELILTAVMLKTINRFISTPWVMELPIAGLPKFMVNRKKKQARIVLNSRRWNGKIVFSSLSRVNIGWMRGYTLLMRPRFKKRRLIRLKRRYCSRSHLAIFFTLPILFLKKRLVGAPMSKQLVALPGAAAIDGKSILNPGLNGIVILANFAKVYRMPSSLINLGRCSMEKLESISNMMWGICLGSLILLPKGN
jgi:high-affinity iron transporter